MDGGLFGQREGLTSVIVVLLCVPEEVADSKADSYLRERA